jgi:serine phosphatase RsbU (regulator of sigma subunit)
MADELSSCYESLSAIFRYSGEQSRAVGMEDFSRRLLGDLLQVTGNSWYQFRLVDPGTQQLELAACSVPDRQVRPLSLAVPSGPGLPLEIAAAQQRRDCWFERGETLSPEDPLREFGLDTAGLVHPLYMGDELVGTLAVGGTGGTRRFTAAKTNVVQTFADFLAIQVVNARFHEQRVRGLLVARELDIARQIQQSLLPARLPQLPNLMLEGHCESAREVGGDFFDVMPLTDGSLLVVVSDAMGKGLPAAMFAMILRSLVRALQDHGPRPGILLRRANDLLYEELSAMEMFITAQVAHVDARSGRVTVASAGHCPLLHCPGSGQPVAAISPEGMPLGVVQTTEFTEQRLALGPGSRLLMYTDGLTETVGPDGTLLGQDRLAAWLIQQAAAGAPAIAMKERLRDYLTESQASPALADDRTFVILGR